MNTNTWVLLNQLLQQHPILFAVGILLFSLAVGSFLNVVIYRIPKMLFSSWQDECKTFLSEHPPEAHDTLKGTFTLAFPLSHCPHCKSRIKVYDNIPVISYLWLKGACRNCHKRISIRYPFVEALTGVMSVIVAIHFGFTLQMCFALLLTWVLIALTFIDFDHQLLPDNLTLPLLWLGLIASTQHIFTDPNSAIIGAAAGYLSLWSIYWLFKLATGKEGMGYGDFKLLATLGAWLGWQQLPVIVFLSSFVGAVIGIGLIFFRGHKKDIPIPFGPYIAIAGWIALLWGEEIVQVYFRYLI